MKFLKIVIGALFIFGSVAFVLSINLPQDVKEAFSDKYPKATSVQWDKDSYSQWQAEFNMDGQTYIAIFQDDGTWMTTKKEKVLIFRD
ncbi:hypothetical protein [Sediminicola arcticus]|jgi:hypothetical protein|uniref:Beta-lactamase-inhibitor-like PepSY-like domain-containing protein n=1 Tax=Sediminicola arcticus TaxID=1574308 RepID=A0ABV2SY80_9FLAO